ncbi:MAG: hypothetical protein U9R48_09930, partial [Chloroflexota bacterium]|nr:hypothetical protein [Chloroflexota bacterium]
MAQNEWRGIEAARGPGGDPERRKKRSIQADVQFRYAELLEEARSASSPIVVSLASRSRAGIEGGKNIMKTFARRSSIVLTVLALLLSFMALPASADVELTKVSEPQVTVDPATAGAAAKYTIEFTTNDLLTGGTDTISIDFPD